MNEEIRPPAAHPPAAETATTSAPVAPLPEALAETLSATPWSLRDLAAFLLFLFPAFVFATMITSSLYGILRTLLRWKAVADPTHNAFFLVPMQTLFYAFVFGFLNALTVVRYRASFWRAIAWVPITGQQRVGFLFAGWLLAIGVQLTSALAPPKQKLPLDQLFSGPAAAYTLAVFGVLIAPLVEEIVFRGFIFAILEKAWGAAVAVIGSGLLFGVIHVPQLWGGWLQIVLLAGVGIIFSLVRARTGSIVPSWLMHACYNLTIFIYFYLSTDGFRRLAG